MDNITLNSGLVVAFQMLGFAEILELPTLQETRRAFFKSARKFHPDKNENKDLVTYKFKGFITNCGSKVDFISG